LLSHGMAGPVPSPPSDWEAVNTHFGSIAHGRIDLLREHKAAQEIQSHLLLSPARVVIFPEAVVPRWTAATDLFWSDTLSALQKVGKTAVIGALRPIGNDGTSSSRRPFEFAATLAALQAREDRVLPITSSPARELGEPPSYHNAVIVRGAQTGEFLQRVPIPLGMWHPWSETGVPLHLQGPGVISLAGRSTALIICYEQMIAWPILTSFLERPSLMVAISNNFWVAGTRIPEIEHNTMQAWAKLFHVPVLFAANS
jgi:apolipoprotein N-acyltransferase